MRVKLSNYISGGNKMGITPISKKEAKKRKKAEKRVVWADNRTFKFTAPKRSDIFAKKSVMVGSSVMTCLGLAIMYSEKSKDIRVRTVGWALSLAGLILSNKATGDFEVKRNVGTIDRMIKEAEAKADEKDIEEEN